MNRAPLVVTTVAALLVGGAVLVVCGVSTFMGLLVLAAISTIVGHEVREARPRAAALPSPPPLSVVVLPDGPGSSSLARWTEQELCRAWQVSYVQLQRHPGATATEHLARARCAYLDELQRRDPAGFAAWIASGARAASDPTRYLTRPPRNP